MSDFDRAEQDRLDHAEEIEEMIRREAEEWNLPPSKFVCEQTHHSDGTFSYMVKRFFKPNPY